MSLHTRADWDMCTCIIDIFLYMSLHHELMFICVFTYMCRYIEVYIYLRYMHMHTYMYTFVHVCMHAWTCVYVDVCMMYDLWWCMEICSFYIHVYKPKREHWHRSKAIRLWLSKWQTRDMESEYFLSLSSIVYNIAHFMGGMDYFFVFKLPIKSLGGP